MRQLVKELEYAAKESRDEEGRTVMPMTLVRQMNFRDVPSSCETFFDAEPSVSGAAPETRKAEARELRAFCAMYRHALEMFNEGGRVDFPMGVWWMMRVLRVECSSRPS